MPFGDYDLDRAKRLGIMLTTTFGQATRNRELGINLDKAKANSEEVRQALEPYLVAMRGVPITRQVPVQNTTAQPTQTSPGTTTIPGDTIASRGNNPLNLQYSGVAKQYGGVPGEKNEQGQYAKFPTVETGLTAAEGQLQRPLYSNLTVHEAMQQWSKEKSGKSGYGGEIYPEIANKKMSDLSDEEMDNLVERMAKKESGTTVVKPGATKAPAKTAEAPALFEQKTETQYPSADEEKRLYTEAVLNLQKNPQNPYAQAAMDNLDKLYATRSKGTITPYEQADLGLRKEEFGQRVKEHEAALSESQAQHAEEKRHNQATEGLRRDTIDNLKNHYSAMEQARAQAGDLFETDAQGNYKLKEGMPTNAIMKARVNTNNTLLAARKLYRDLQSQVEFGMGSQDELDQVKANIEDLQKQFNALSPSGGKQAAPAAGQGDKYKSVDEFKDAFKKEMGRDPSDSEIEKAKGKYY